MRSAYESERRRKIYYFICKLFNTNSTTKKKTWNIIKRITLNFTNEFKRLYVTMYQCKLSETFHIIKHNSFTLLVCKIYNAKSFKSDALLMARFY